MANDQQQRDFYRDVARRVVNRAFPKFTPSEKGALMRVVVEEMRKAIVTATGDISDFHMKFGLEYHGPPRFLSDEMTSFRVGFMQEELDEYKSAVYAGDMEKQFDALIDLIYVALGTSYLHGFPFGAGWREVHRANMLKVRAESSEQSARGSTLDVIKPPGWTPPDIYEVLERRKARFRPGGEDTDGLD